MTVDSLLGQEGRQLCPTYRNRSNDPVWPSRKSKFKKIYELLAQPSTFIRLDCGSPMSEAHIDTFSHTIVSSYWHFCFLSTYLFVYLFICRISIQSFGVKGPILLTYKIITCTKLTNNSVWLHIYISQHS